MSFMSCDWARVKVNQLNLKPTNKEEKKNSSNELHCIDLSANLTTVNTIIIHHIIVCTRCIFLLTIGGTIR